MGRRHAASAALSLLLSGLVLACDQAIEIGVTLPRPESTLDSGGAGTHGSEAASPSGAGGASPLAGSSAGASGSDDAGAAGVGGEPSATDPGILWSSGFESGDVSEWTADGAAMGGEIQQAVTARVSTTQAHSGGSALQLSFDEADGEHHWAELHRKTEAGPAYYSAWFLLSEQHDPGVYWSIFYFFSETTPGDSSTRRPLWDLNLNSSTLYFYDERSQKFVDAMPATPYPVGRWFQLEAYLEHPPGASAHLIVWQDGIRILDLPNLPPAPSEHVYWAIGTQSDQLTPAKCTLFLDDAVIARERVGP